MARWERAPRPDVELLKEYLDANVLGCSAAYDKNMKLQHLEIEGMADDELAKLIDGLQMLFPQAF